MQYSKLLLLAQSLKEARLHACNRTARPSNKRQKTRLETKSRQPSTTCVHNTAEAHSSLQPPRLASKFPFCTRNLAKLWRLKLALSCGRDEHQGNQSDLRTIIPCRVCFIPDTCFLIHHFYMRRGIVEGITRAGACCIGLSQLRQSER